MNIVIPAPPSSIVWYIDDKYSSYLGKTLKGYSDYLNTICPSDDVYPNRGGDYICNYYTWSYSSTWRRGSEITSFSEQSLISDRNFAVTPAANTYWFYSLADAVTDIDFRHGNSANFVFSDGHVLSMHLSEFSQSNIK